MGGALDRGRWRGCSGWVVRWIGADGAVARDGWRSELGLMGRWLGMGGAAAWDEWRDCSERTEQFVPHGESFTSDLAVIYCRLISDKSARK